MPPKKNTTIKYVNEDNEDNTANEANEANEEYADVVEVEEIAYSSVEEKEDSEEEEDEEEEEEEEDEEEEEENLENLEKDEENLEDDDCVYTSRKTKSSKSYSAGIDREDEDDDTILRLLAKNLNKKKYADAEDRILQNKLTKYEITNILITRAAQLEQGAKANIKNVSKLSSSVIAQLELESKRIPFKIVRTHEDGTKDIWKFADMVLPKQYIKYGFTGDKDIDINKIEKMSYEYKYGGNIDGYNNVSNDSLTQEERKKNNKKQ